MKDIIKETSDIIVKGENNKTGLIGVIALAGTAFLSLCVKAIMDINKK